MRPPALLATATAIALLIAPLMTPFAHAQDTSSILAVPPAAAPQAMPDRGRGEDWRAAIGTFKVGMVRGWSSDMSPAVIARFEASLSAALAMPVRVVLFERFLSLVDAQATSAIDYAIYSARAYAAGQLACECLDVIARPTSETGSEGQVHVLLADPVRVASVNALAGLPDGRLGRLAEQATAPSALLAGGVGANGALLTGRPAAWRVFATSAEMRAAYAAGEIDGYVLAKQARSANDPVSAASDDGQGRPARAIWTSAFWPFGPHVVRASLPGEARAALVTFLAELDVTDPVLHALVSEGLSGPIRPARPEDYRAVRRAVQLLADSAP